MGKRKISEFLTDGIIITLFSQGPDALDSPTAIALVDQGSSNLLFLSSAWITWEKEQVDLLITF